MYISQKKIDEVKRQFGIIGNHKDLNHAIAVAIQIAATDMTVLITGESGSGKEAFAKIIHHLSKQKHHQFITINCGALPEGTIDSEIFGHVKGAFTGALDSRKGYFEEAENGTLFLDEIGEMPLSTQARLLRVLEYGEFLKVGSSKVQKAKVRLVAATHVNLKDNILKKKFREDLFFRLNTIPIYIPPLRERKEDILFLVRKFSNEFSEKYQIPSIQLTQEAEAVLLAYRFPGNIRELKNLIDQISILEIERTITKQQLINYLPKQQSYLPDTTQEIKQEKLLYKNMWEMQAEIKLIKSLLLKLISSKENIPHQKMMQEYNHILFTETPKQVMLNKASNFKPLKEENSLKNKELKEKKTPLQGEIQKENQTYNLAEQEKKLIQTVLEKNVDKRKNAAQILGISERTLYRKIKEYNL